MIYQENLVLYFNFEGRGRVALVERRGVGLCKYGTICYGCLWMSVITIVISIVDACSLPSRQKGDTEFYF